MTSQPGLETVSILFSISQSKGNQTVKFGLLIEYNKINIFLQKLCGKLGRETTFIHLLFFDKASYEVKASGMEFSFNIFR